MNDSSHGVVAALTVTAALVLQSTLFPYLAWQGIVPNLVLLVVVATALARGGRFAVILGFAAGVLLDLAPSSDHLAGRWALALVVVAWVAGRVAEDVESSGSDRPSTTTCLATVAATSFLGTSLFALSGLLLGDGAGSVPDLLTVVGVALLWDLLLTPFVVPLVLGLHERLEPDRVAA